MQEAYCPPCSEYSFCWPILADPLPPDPLPPSWTDLTPPPQLDWPDPPQLDWPSPPLCLDWPDSPPAGLTPLQVWTDWKHYLPHPSDVGGKKVHFHKQEQLCNTSKLRTNGQMVVPVGIRSDIYSFCVFIKIKVMHTQIALIRDNIIWDHKI